MSYNSKFHEKITAQTGNKAIIPIIDAHLHLVDCLQGGDGIKKLLEKMRAANIDRCVIFGLPIKKKWEAFEPRKPHHFLDDESRCYYYSLTDFTVADEYQKLSPKKKKQFAPLLCGFNPTDRCAIDYVEKMFKTFPFWKGIGEILLRHDDLTTITNDDIGRANHPALLPIYKFCVKKNLPILIHQNITSIYDNQNFRYIHELKEVLKKFPKLKIVWAHCGISRNVSHPNYAKNIDRMLNQYKNLTVDISWIVYDEIICERSKPKKEWITLIEKYPSRFMVGSDCCGKFEHLGKNISRYNKLFEILSKKTREMVASKNANRLFFR